jgi:hypothetical protein
LVSDPTVLIFLIFLSALSLSWKEILLSLLSFCSIRRIPALSCGLSFQKFVVERSLFSELVIYLNIILDENSGNAGTLSAISCFS